MSWHGHLTLDYRLDNGRTIALDRHDGPLRVLQRLYPEGPAICHHVLVHPPGGIVGGDVLDVQAHLAAGTHALITTPGATRFYRSAGPEASQNVAVHVAEGARLEWLPLETIAYRGCRARNKVSFDLAPGGEAIGWDVLALGLPAAGEAFDDPNAPASWYAQDIGVDGRWLERGTVHSSDSRLLDSPLGWAGRRVMGTLWFAAGLPLAATRREALLELARAALAGSESESDRGRQAAGLLAGATSPQDSVVVLRVLGERVEPVMRLMQAVWGAWRQQAWEVTACPPRVWRT